MFVLALLGAFVMIFVQTVIWRKYIYAYFYALLFVVFQKAEIIRIIVAFLFILLGDYLAFSGFAFLSSKLSGFGYVAFYVISALVWYFSYGGSAYRRNKYMRTVDVANDSTFAASVKRDTTELEFLLLDIEGIHVSVVVLFIVALAIWPSLGLWS